MSEEIKIENKRKSGVAVNSRWFFVVVIAIIFIAAAIASCFIFFKVEKIEVVENDVYSHDDIIAISEIKIGDNILFMDTKSIEDRIYDTFPYVEKATIIKKIPFTVSIEITPAEEFYSVKNGDGYVLVSKYGKLLARMDVIKDKTAELIIGNVTDENGHMKIVDENVDDIFNEISKALLNLDKGKITSIDILDVNNIIVEYEDRVTMKLGDAIDLEDKLRYGLQILEGEHIGKTEQGTLDLRVSNKGYFKPSVGEGVVVTPSPEATEKPNIDSNRGDDIPDV